ncbi:uncharacterized protein LOC125540230 [Triticum urartu]|uniref:uncharacterized protein LOC125540230 n=1 Tax=Triticum urartu TaxID=4572 RepID=UPI002043945B|nr:uncharacterized protein LOC125540230 [Triticum urartu]
MARSWRAKSRLEPNSARLGSCPALPTTAVFTPEEVTSILQDLVMAVQGIYLYLPGPPAPPPAATTAAYGHPALPWPSQGVPAMGGPLLPPFQAGHPSGPPPPLLHLPWYSVPTAIIGAHPSFQPPPAPMPSWPQWPAPILAAPSAPAPAPHWPVPAPAMPTAPPAPVQLPSPPPSSGLGQSTPGGLPIQQVRFPPSPSQIPAWLTGTSPPPVYTEAGDSPVPTLQSGASSGSAGAYVGLPTVDRAPSSSLLRIAEPVGHGAPTQTPPRFAKIDFATYDGTEDPINWLNQCEQFFRGQCTLASERTWLASYHLRGAAQTWYYALEQDEGSMPPWERFRELCLLRFGPPIRGSRLAELGRLPFTSTVQDFADRFQAVACHASGVTAQQRADLFVGGHPDHIRMDVELQGPQDIQTAMYYARAFERRTVAVQQESPSRATGSLPWPDPAPGRTVQASAAPLAATAARPFRWLTSAELLERRRQGLCFNCDEPYTPAHACPRLFYLAVADYIPEDAVVADLAAPVVAKVFDAG